MLTEYLNPLDMAGELAEEVQFFVFKKRHQTRTVNQTENNNFLQRQTIIEI